MGERACVREPCDLVRNDDQPLLPLSGRRERGGVGARGEARAAATCPPALPGGGPAAAKRGAHDDLPVLPDAAAELLPVGARGDALPRAVAQAELPLVLAPCGEGMGGRGEQVARRRAAVGGVLGWGVRTVRPSVSAPAILEAVLPLAFVLAAVRPAERCRVTGRGAVRESIVAPSGGGMRKLSRLVGPLPRHKNAKTDSTGISRSPAQARQERARPTCSSGLYRRTRRACPRPTGGLPPSTQSTSRPAGVTAAARDGGGRSPSARASAALPRPRAVPERHGRRRRAARLPARGWSGRTLNSDKRRPCSQHRGPNRQQARRVATL